MSRAPKTQRWQGSYGGDGDLLEVNSYDPDDTRQPILVIPEQALKDCAKKGHPNRTSGRIARGHMLEVCRDCGAWRFVKSWFSVNRWTKPTLLRVARRKR